MSDEKKVIHVTKFDKGQRTPAEYHREYALGNRSCDFCGLPAAIRIKVFADPKEFVQRKPELAAAIMATNPRGPFLPGVETVWGTMVKVEDACACDLCKESGVRALGSKWPKDWCHHEVDRFGLESEHKQVYATGGTR
jgi:hypothetical protein